MLHYFSLQLLRRHLTSSCYSMKLSAIMRCVYWAGVPTAGSFSRYGHHQKKTKEWLEFSWGLYCLVVLFLLVYVICASIPTEGTVKQGLTTGITEVKNQNLSQVYPWHHTLCALLIPLRCQISKINYSHVQDSQVTTLWSFLVVRNCFENLSWYFLACEQALCLGKKISSFPLDQSLFTG